jgi:hypothetical protein
MRTRDLINLEEAYMSVYEASYIPKTTSVGNIAGLSDPSKIEARTKESEKAIEDNFKKLEMDKDNLDAAVDILNLMDQLGTDVFTIDGKTHSAEDLYKKILEVTKTTEHDYELLTHHTILDYKKAGGSEAWYHLYKELFKRLGMEAAPYNRREISTRSAIVFYFGTDGEPYKTTLKVGDDGIVHGTGFWRSNNPYGMSETQIRSGNKEGVKPKPWGKFKPYIDGMSIDEIRQKVNHDQAATAFEAKFPPLQFPQYYTKR